MTEKNFHRNNHYVPRTYLKRWKSSHNKVWTYRTLVSHENVPLWKESSVKAIAYHSHLYTRIASGHQSDEIEKWFDREYEMPAKHSIQKVVSDGRLTASDWENLVRFFAAQDVRTPARMLEHFKRWNTELPDLLQNTLNGVVRRLEDAMLGGEKLQEADAPFSDYIPLRVTTKIQPEEEFGILKAETFVGRGTWLFSIRHLLASTAKVLHQHKWTIMLPAKGMIWFTSDSPTIRLNFYSMKNYDFLGGWGKKGTEIFLPLSPNHLLYTQVGKRPPSRGSRFSSDHTRLIRRFISEHAYRMIFSDRSDLDVEILRPRIVSADQMQNEISQWNQWHEEQTDLEKELAGSIENNDKV